MKIKTSELKDAALDWAVAKCEGLEHVDYIWEPSTDWSQGGPIIKREKISIRQWANVSIVHAYMPDGEWSADEQSPLIAAMRCYVESKLGNEVDVPEELCK